MPRGLILFAHGARDRRWADPFEAVARRIRVRAPQVPVRLAYLDLMAPSLAQAAEDLVAAGCRCVNVLPMFLGTGGHLRRDLPPLVDGLRARHAAVEWRLHAAIGEHALVGDAMAAAALALLCESPSSEGTEA